LKYVFEQSKHKLEHGKVGNMQRIIVDEKAEQFGLTGAWRVCGIYQ